MLAKTASTRRSPRTARGFTLVELLTVIGIILLLLSLLAVGLRKAQESARRANTTALMQTLKQALVRFQGDVGYLPPVLDENRNVIATPGPLGTGEGGDAAAFERYQLWRSGTTLAEYLVGYDEARYDGYGDTALGEVPFTGLRHPGNDGAWGATRTDGLLEDRVPVPPAAGGPAQVYGPYLELDNPRLLGAVDFSGGSAYDPNTGQLKVRLPGENGYDPDAPKVILDYWGNAIEYFRRPYPPGSIGQSYRAGLDHNADGSVTAHDQPSLSWIAKLRPYRLAPGQGQDLALWNGAMSPYDPTTTASLEAAEFALFSPGTDRLSDWRARVDVQEWNADNLVEVGP